MAARRWGHPEGPKVLALHGWLDNAATFDRLAPGLPELDLVCLDLPGHGLSDHRPPGVAYHLVDGLGDVLAAAEGLGWGRFTLLGHSMGGAVGTLAAAAVPDRVERLLLVESLGPVTDPAEQMPDRLKAHARGWRELATKRLPVYPDTETACRARMSAGDLSLESARILASRGTKPVEGGFTWRSDPRLKVSSPFRLTEEQVLAVLEAVRCPTLVVRAEGGILQPETKALRRAERIRDVRVELVAGGHHVHLDHPERVTTPLRNFLGLPGAAR